MTELAISKDLDDALLAYDEDVVEALDGLPEEKLHCSVLGIQGCARQFRIIFSDTSAVT